MKKIESYDGVLDGKSTSPDVRRAYQSWLDQRKRCSNHRAKAFQWYGARGIRVEYSSREFVGWYLKELKSRKWKDPTTGRIDHNKNYCFENIFMQERSDNVRECAIRTNSKTKKPSFKILIGDRRTGEPLMICSSRSEASRLTGVSKANIWAICSGASQGSRSGFYFRHYGGSPFRTKR